MSRSHHALTGGCSAGALAPLPAMRVFICPAVKLQRRPGPAPVLETKPPVERVAGRSTFSVPGHAASGRRIEEP